ncbi:MAG: TatD family nuclease-associated radical SAM protein [Candidatus Gastranaerophilales bacterium]|nr:TatD family nuclease-associated radical SAM protein [Candidatus Gastranaerophilales bacterium]
MYINLTNLCTCRCVFCIRDLNSTVEGVDMKLDNLKANPDEVIKYIKQLENKIGNEVVFCGYGEPMLELDSLKKVSKFIKENYPDIKIRVNTNGHANLVHKRDVVPELLGLVDSFSVSLNADNAKQYKEITNCSFEAEIGFKGMIDFIKSAVNNGITTYATVVSGFEGADIDIDKCEKLATSLGATFRVREYLNEGYSKP